MWICPVCNGLSKLQGTCPQCGGLMEDRGTVEDFRGPYSPYETAGEAFEALCLHLIACPQCGWDERKKVSKNKTPELPPGL